MIQLYWVMSVIQLCYTLICREPVEHMVNNADDYNGDAGHREDISETEGEDNSNSGKQEKGEGEQESTVNDSQLDKDNIGMVEYLEQ